MTLVIALFLRIDSILRLGDWLYGLELPSISLYICIFVVRFLLGAIAVILVLPAILPQVADAKNSLIQILRTIFTEHRNLVIGFLSGGLFLVIGMILSLFLSVHVNLTTVFATPDVYVDPDVVGWAYFLLALVPAIWEELVFRGLILVLLRRKYSKRRSILFSSLLFSLYHFSMIFVWPIGQVIGGVIMSFLFGLAWGFLVVKTRSIVPAVVSHYVVDSLGQMVMQLDNVDTVVGTKYMLLLTLSFPIIHYIALILLPISQNELPQSQLNASIFQ